MYVSSIIPAGNELQLHNLIVIIYEQIMKLCVQARELVKRLVNTSILLNRMSSIVE